MKLRWLFVGWYTIGLILMFFYRIPAWLTFSNGLFLVFYAICAIDITARDLAAYAQVIWKSIFIGIIALIIEIVGVHTGFPFGSYHYETTLGFIVFGVPLPIAAAWVGVILNALVFTNAKTKWLRALETGVWVVLLDMILDPVALIRQFWTWTTDGVFFGVPLENFAGWLILSTLFTLLFPLKTFTKPARKWAVRIYQMMLLMFGILAVKAGIHGIGALSIAFIFLSQWRLNYDYRRKKAVV